MVKRKIKKTLFGIFGLYIMFGTTLYFLQEKVLFRPTVLAQDYVYNFDSNFEELFLKDCVPSTLRMLSRLICDKRSTASYAS